MSKTTELKLISAAPAVDPLPSWRPGQVKSSLLRFIAEASRIDGPSYVPPAERIAVFDNDGTLWCERPIQFEVYFAFDRLAKLAQRNPALRDRPAFRALLERNLRVIAELSKRAALEGAFAAHAGMTPDEFEGAAQSWLETARHPTLGRLFKDCAYLPQLELLKHLRERGFTNYVVSDGAADFARALAQDVYSMPAAHVIGSDLKTRLIIRDGDAALVKLDELDCFNEHDAKPENIQRHIGKRPLLAFGNSDSDLAMLRYTLSGKGKRMAMILHHDDRAREFAYDRAFRMDPLAKGLDRARDLGLTVVSMKRDWKRIFRAAALEARPKAA